MKISEIKKILNENFEEEFQNYVGNIKLKENFYAKRNYIGVLSAIAFILGIYFFIGMVTALLPFSFLLKDLVRFLYTNIFMIFLIIWVIYHLITPTLTLNFKEKKLCYSLNRIAFSSIDTLKLKNNFKLEVNYKNKKILIDVGKIKNNKRLILILKKEFGEKFIF